MNKLQKLRAWTKNHILALVAATIFILAHVALVYVIIAPQENIYVLQARLQQLGFFSLGLWLPLLGWLIHSLYTGLNLPPLIIQILLVILIPLCGLLLGLFVQERWQEGWGGRLVLAIVFAINAFFGWMVTYFYGFLVSDTPAVVCEQYISQTSGIRVVHYYHINSRYGFLEYFFLSTSDQGKHWRQLDYFRYYAPWDYYYEWGLGNNPVLGSCSTNSDGNLQTIEFTAMGTPEFRFHTTDGGLTWEIDRE
jgi:hypothetical protein